LALFPKQLGILRRGLALLAPGGQLIYSTCSLDPLQNEAVVAAALHLHNMNEKQHVHLESPDGKLPKELAMACTPGLRHWLVPAPDFSHSDRHMFRSWVDVPAAAKLSNGVRLRQEMFCDFSSEAASECCQCRRALPSDRLNSSVVFIASFRKTDISASHKEKVTFAPRTHNIFRSVQSMNGFHHTQGCVLKFFGLHTQEVEAVRLGVERFPLECLGVHPVSRDTVLLLMPQSCPLQSHKDLNALGGGLPLLHKVTSSASGAGKFFDGEPERAFQWRPSQEGVAFLGRCCARRLIVLPRDILRTLLLDGSLSFHDVSIPETCFVGCRVWGDTIREGFVPGGVIVCLAGISAQGDCLRGPPFFAALLSSSRLQLVGWSDVAERNLFANNLGMFSDRMCQLQQ